MCCRLQILWFAQALRRLPKFGATCTFSYTIEVWRHPTAIEPPWLRMNVIVADAAFLHEPRVKRQISSNRLELLRWLVIAPGTASCGRRPADHIKVSRSALSLAKTSARCGDQSRSHILRREAVGRRVVGFQNT